ncbi:MAG: TIM barrel protein [Chloroflexi bacterium]|nr:TIM barrel protein [Chloroflexota bacterium]MYF81910.1 TIM barrel protein [Chloroflexota bacterium]MYI05330.1 TIM barrel protein [Chloroflexota bacterium]
MPKLAASLSWMFQEVELLERFQAAAEAGFRAVEIQAPYSEPAPLLAERACEAGLTVALINTPVALAAVPGKRCDFRRGIETTLEYAKSLDCSQIHCLAGRTDHPDAETTFIDNLRWAADRAAAQDARIMLEPLNTTDNPGYFLTGSAQARRIIEQVDRDNVRMQYDCYHMQIMEGNLTETIRTHLDVIGHVQISGVPGRHEPDPEQEINYPYVLSLIDELGYDGWVGCEYRPRESTLAGFEWARPYGIGRGPRDE